MKKVLVWHWGRRGGGPRYTLELARELSEFPECEVYLSLSKQCEIYNEFEGLGIARFDVDTYVDKLSAIRAISRIPKLRQCFWDFVEEQEIDIVLCTMSHLFNVALLWKRKWKGHYSLVLHDATPHPGEDYGIRGLLLNTEVACADSIVTLTNYVKNSLIDRIEYPSDLVGVIPHGSLFYNREPRTVTARPLRVLFFGRILPYKGLDLFLDAALVLESQAVDFHVDVVGPGDISSYQEQINRLRNITVDNRWIPEEEVASVFSNADLVVLPYIEASQSGVIAVAFFLGIPVVVTPTGGLAEQVEHLVTGIVTSETSSDAVAEGMKVMLGDHDLRKNCGLAARRYAETSMSWKAIATEFKGFLEIN